MKRILAVIFALGLTSSAAFAQARTDFTGTWRMDPSRSESAMQGEPMGPVTVNITQNDREIQIETISKRGRSVETYRLDGKDSPLRSGVGEAHWFGDSLVVNALRDVRGVSVTTEQRRRLTADGSEMHVDSILQVQHGYTLANTRNWGAGRDVYVRVR